VHREDPLSGVANLFDASIVFALGIMVALLQAFSLAKLLDPNSSFTIVSKNAAGEMEIIERNRDQVKVRRITPEKQSGQGKRVGIAYELPDGSVVYVPESSPPAPAP
jgi:hypothetical protein